MRQKERMKIVEEISYNLLDYISDRIYKDDYSFKDYQNLMGYIHNKVDIILGIAIDSYTDEEYNEFLKIEERK